MFIDKTLILNEKNKYNFIPELSFILTLSIAICFIYYLNENVIFYGHKTIAIFDIWSIAHLFSGMTLSYLAINFRKHFKHPLALMLLWEFIWETTEHYLETVSTELIIEWFGGVEHWSNRLIADPLMMILGFYLIKKYPNSINYVRILSAAFILFHIAVRDSMFFH